MPPRRRSLSPVIWGFPLVLATLLALTASHLTKEERRRELLQRFGVTEEDLKAVSLEGPGGFPLTEQQLEALTAPHKHELPPRFAVTTTSGFEVILPHFGDGTIPGTDQSFRTTWNIVNFSNGKATGTLQIFNDQGEPEAIMVNGVIDSVFDFELATNSITEFTTAGTGDVKGGWALIQADQPVAGSARFGLQDGQGSVLTDVGVASALPGTEFTFFADTLGQSDTGLAVVNASPTKTVTISFELRDSAGNVKATRSRDLPPFGHLALFLPELFSGVAGIDEFEGSVIITTPDPVAAGITLRVTGPVLTSLPMVPPPADPDVRKLAFPHIADGVAETLIVNTSTIVFNNTDNPAMGTVEFFKSDSSALEVSVGNKTASSFDFALNPRGVVRLRTAGTGDLETGWARVTMDQPLSGSAMFSIFDTAAPLSSSQGLGATLVTEVGVGSATLTQQDTFLIADSRGGFNTGIALVNPLPNQDRMTIFFFLVTADGQTRTQRRIDAPPLTHRALFMTEIFEGFPGIDDFNGHILVSGAGNFLAPLVLRSAGVKLTSTPLFERTNGFAPESTLSLSNNLTGASPVVEWRIHQRDDDVSLHKIKISAPGLGLDTSGVEVGNIVVSGFLPADRNSQRFQFIAKEKGSLLFDAVALTKDGLEIQATGRFDGSPTGGLTFEFERLGSEPFTKVGEDGDHIYTLPAGLIRAPASPGTVTITTDFLSVSSQPDADVPVTRTTTQELDFVAPAPNRPHLTGVSSTFPQPGEILTLSGSNLTDGSLVHFPVAREETVVFEGQITEEGDFIVPVPSNLASGPIQVENGAGKGNLFQFRTLFSPGFEAAFTTGAGDGGLGELLLGFDMPAEQFFMDSVIVTIPNFDADFTGLTPETKVGSGETTGFFVRQTRSCGGLCGSQFADPGCEAFDIWKQDGQSDPGKVRRFRGHVHPVDQLYARQ